MWRAYGEKTPEGNFQLQTGLGEPRKGQLGAETTSPAQGRARWRKACLPAQSSSSALLRTAPLSALVAKFLDERGIVVEKTGPYNLLFLFSIGIDKTNAM